MVEQPPLIDGAPTLEYDDAENAWAENPPQQQDNGQASFDRLRATNQARVDKLIAQRKLDPLYLLKLRVDLLTKLLVPDSLVETLNVSWEITLSNEMDRLENPANDLVVPRV